MSIHIGTSGWVYDDWCGIVYPKSAQRDALSWIARYFGTVEINSSFYRPPSRKSAKGWVEKVADYPDFVFSAKLCRRFTHDKAPPTRAEIMEFTVGLEPLAEAEKLGCVLAQFSYAFTDTKESRQRLAEIARDFGHWPLALEVRHADWASPDALRFINDHGFSLVLTDQPRTQKSMPNKIVPDAKVGYIRLHGRSRAWFNKNAGRDEKYDYLYPAPMLKGFAEMAAKVASEGKKTFVFTNNHYRGQAAANALQLRFLIEGRKISAPASLVQTYPELASCTIPTEEGHQGTLL